MTDLETRRRRAAYALAAEEGSRSSALLAVVLFLVLDLAIGGAILVHVYRAQAIPAIEDLRAAYAEIGDRLAALSGPDAVVRGAGVALELDLEESRPSSLPEAATTIAALWNGALAGWDGAPSFEAPDLQAPAADGWWGGEVDPGSLVPDAAGTLARGFGVLLGNDGGSE